MKPQNYYSWNGYLKQQEAHAGMKLSRGEYENYSMTILLFGSLRCSI